MLNFIKLSTEQEIAYNAVKSLNRFQIINLFFRENMLLLSILSYTYHKAHACIIWNQCNICFGTAL